MTLLGIVFHSVLLQTSYASRTSSLLTLLRLRSVLASDAPHAALDFEESEGSAIFTACDALLGEESDTKNTILLDFLSGEGDLNGVSCKPVEFQSHETNQPSLQIPGCQVSYSLSSIRRASPLPCQPNQSLLKLRWRRWTSQ
jgi:hypothetical protein